MQWLNNGVNCGEFKMYKISESIRVGLSMSGLRQKDLAEQMRMTEVHISNLVNNKYSTTFETAEKIAVIFGVNLSTFIEWGES